MSKPFKQALLIACGINTGLLLLGFLNVMFMILMLIFSAVECLVGAALVTRGESRQTGQGLILAGLLGLLIGYSVCSGMLRMV